MTAEYTSFVAIFKSNGDIRDLIIADARIREIMGDRFMSMYMSVNIREGVSIHFRDFPVESTEKLMKALTTIYHDEDCSVANMSVIETEDDGETECYIYDSDTDSWKTANGKIYEVRA